MRGYFTLRPQSSALDLHSSIQMHKQTLLQSQLISNVLGAQAMFLQAMYCFVNTKEI